MGKKKNSSRISDHPSTMMVKAGNTAITYAAMLRPGRSKPQRKKDKVKEKVRKGKEGTKPNSINLFHKKKRQQKENVGKKSIKQDSLWNFAC